MTLEQQEKFFEAFTAHMKVVMLSKGHDYSSQDRLSNFKFAGHICGMTAHQNCLNLIATKVARLGQLFSSGREPVNESVHDSILDLANYSVLLAMIIQERSDLITDKPKRDDPVKNATESRF